MLSHCSLLPPAAQFWRQRQRLCCHYSPRCCLLWSCCQRPAGQRRCCKYLLRECHCPCRQCREMRSVGVSKTSVALAWGHACWRPTAPAADVAAMSATARLDRRLGSSPHLAALTPSEWGGMWKSCGSWMNGSFSCSWCWQQTTPAPMAPLGTREMPGISQLANTNDFGTTHKRQQPSKGQRDNSRVILILWTGNFGLIQGLSAPGFTPSILLWLKFPPTDLNLSADLLPAPLSPLPKPEAYNIADQVAFNSTIIFMRAC